MSSRPHGPALTTLKGVAITTTILSAGQLLSASLLLPSLYPAAEYSHRLIARQWAAQYRFMNATSLPVDLFTTLVYGGLAWLGYSERAAGARSGDVGGWTWTLWAGAVGLIVATIPWTAFMMEEPSRKLLWISEVADTATTTREPEIRVSTPHVRITSPSPMRRPEGETRGRSPAARFANGFLGVPGAKGPGSGTAGGVLTPIEEFEPFDDAPLDEREYVQFKVVGLLQSFRRLNEVRAGCVFGAGMLGLWAALAEGMGG